MRLLVDAVIILASVFNIDGQNSSKNISIEAPKNGDRYDFDFVYSYTKYLHGIYRFNSFVIFSHDEARLRPSFLVARTFEQALCVDFNMPIIVYGRKKTAQLRHVIGLNNMVFVQFNSIRDSILESVDYTLEGLHFITILFFYKTKDNTPPTAKEIRGFFAWCWFRNMINVALTFQVIARATITKQNQTYIQNQVYTYTPFPELTIFNLTDEVAKGKGEYTTDRIKDVRGYVFHTHTFKQPPYVFLTAYHRDCNGLKYCSQSLTGVAGHIYKEYVRQINGTIELVPYFNPNSVREVLLAAARKKADIVPHPFSELIMNNDMSAGSYPIAQTNLCIIVPTVREMDRQHYLPHAFQLQIWFYVLLTFLLLLFIEICFNSKALNAGIQSMSYALMAAVNLLLYQANMPFPSPSPSQTKTHLFGFRLHTIFYIIIPLMTFVLTAMYDASLTSLLTTTPYGLQIDTVAQMLASNLEIMITSHERTLFFETNRLPAELIPKLRIAEHAIVEQHRSSLNVSFAYLATAEDWTLLDYQQQHLRKPLFRLPGRELCTAKFFLRFPVQWDSPFTLSLDIFFMTTQESGLNEAWLEISTYRAKQLNFVKAVQKDIDRWTPLSLQHFIFVIYLICSLWLMAALCLCLEMLWFYILSEYFNDLKKEIGSHFVFIKRSMLRRLQQFYRENFMA